MQAYESNWMSTVGENIDTIEHQISEKIGCKYAVALSSGTAALHLAIKSLEIKPGEHVFEYSGVAEPCFPLKEPPNIPVKRANLSANESQ